MFSRYGQEWKPSSEKKRVIGGRSMDISVLLFGCPELVGQRGGSDSYEGKIFRKKNYLVKPL